MVMTDYTSETVRALMSKPTHVRNVCICGHVKDGVASSLLEPLVVRTETVERNAAEDMGINFAKTFLMRGLGSEIIEEDSQNELFLLNLVQPPTSGDRFSEAITALRITDGSIIIMDCLEGLTSQIEIILRQAISEGVQIAVFVDGLDFAFLPGGDGEKVGKEDAYEACLGLVKRVKDIIFTESGSAHEEDNLCTVAFGSTAQGWGFTSRGFASVGVAGAENASQSILDSVFRLITAITGDNDQEAVEKLLRITLNPDERLLFVSDLPLLLHTVFCGLFPISSALAELIIYHLPSPVAAQTLRLERLYEGPMTDECAAGIRTCNPDGPLMVYISRIVRVPSSPGAETKENAETGTGEEKARLYAVGRVFSGTVCSGAQVRIQGLRYTPGRKDDLFVKPVHEIRVMTIRNSVSLESCPAGNIILLSGLDKFLLKSATMTSLETAYNIKAMRIPVPAIVQIAVTPTEPKDLPRLLDLLKTLSQCHPHLEVQTSETGAHIVSGPSELYVRTVLKDMEPDVVSKCTLSNPIVSYRETVKSTSSKIALSKSPNKHNRFYFNALPLEPSLIHSIESDTISTRGDFKDHAAKIAKTFECSEKEARKIWCFGPEDTGPNILVDTTRGVQFLHEVKDSSIAAFQWATVEGVCAEERLRGVRFNIVDVAMFSDAIHRGGGQIIPTVRRVCHAACLLATPGIQEPIYTVEFKCPGNANEQAAEYLARRRGGVIAQERRHGAVYIKAHLPVAESFGFERELESILGLSYGSCQFTFNHWDLMHGSPLDAEGEVVDIVRKIRVRKGLEPEIPPLEKYCDKH